MQLPDQKNRNGAGIRINLSKKILFFSMAPFLLVLLIISAITINNKIDSEEKLLVTRLNNYAVLLESGALSLESITQKDKLESSLEEHVLIAEIIKDDYSTPYSTEPMATSTSVDKVQVDKAFREKDSVIFATNQGVYDYFYPIVYKGSVVGIFHVSLSDIYIKKRISEHLLLVFFLNVFGLLISFFLIVLLVKHGILERLSELMKGSEEITSGNLDYVIDIKSNDEIGDLKHSFNEMTRNLRDTIASRDVLLEEVNERNIMLRDSEQRVRNANIELEARVQQRTSELAVAKEKAETANRAKSVFLANMSHELRTPLNAILGFSSLMRQDPLVPDSQRHNLDIINWSGEHLLRLLNDILDMAKIEAGQIKIENMAFDLTAMVRDVADMMRLRAEDKNLRLRVDQTSHFPHYVYGDEARLRQILINLMGNAIKHTHEGEVILRLGSKSNDKDHLLIEVVDTGIGITLEEQQRIFEPFVQLGDQSGRKGVGLGLTITRQYVQMMGGSVSVESTLGEGSRFKVELPFVEAKEKTIVKMKPAEIHKVTGLAPGQPEYRILIVEDQYENQLLLSALMESVGLQIKTAENGAQGVELFQSWHPHLIWMDQRMPVMGGVEATRRIRELPEGKNTIIIAVTATALAEQRKEILAAGMDDYVCKPYRVAEIYDCLAKHLGVKYLYEGMPEPSNRDLLLSPQMLKKLPKELLAELKSALESLDTDRIEAVLQRIAEHDETLHKKLSYLARSFDYPAILRVLKACE